MSKVVKFILLTFLFYVEGVYAAYIHGNIYDVSDFTIIKDCVLEVNSTSPIKKVLSSGTYDIEVKEGCYTLHIVCYEQGIKTKEGNASLCLKEKDNITYDILVFPVIIDDVENMILHENFSDVNQYVFYTSSFNFNYIYLLFVAIIPIIAYYLYRRRKLHKILTDDSMKMLLKILKKEQRINQKDLVKAMRLSDAKISLMITELEREGIVKKIKKGRSNIIIYKG